jgi:hypothetical protein
VILCLDLKNECEEQKEYNDSRAHLVFFMTTI